MDLWELNEIAREYVEIFIHLLGDAFAATSWTMVMKRGPITGSLLENSLGFAMNRACRPAPGHVGLPTGKLLSTDEPDSGRSPERGGRRLQSPEAVQRCGGGGGLPVPW